MNKHPGTAGSFARRQNLFGWIIIVCVIACSAYLLYTAAEKHTGTVVLFVAPLLLGAWVFCARSQWWAVIPLGCGLGGLFYFGFRIYTHELALALAMLALLPYIAVATVDTRARPKTPVALYLLLAFLTAHLLVSEVLCINDGMGGIGNVLRVYMYGLWAVVFAILFFKYGSTRHLKYVLSLMYLASFIRVAMGLLACLCDDIRVFYYIPFINYVPSGSYTAGMDLRTSSLLLASLALCHSSLAKSRVTALIHLAMLVPAGYMLLLGAGRTSLALFFCTICLWILLRRKFVLLGCVAIAFALLVGILNSNPHIIDRADPRIQRTLSILIAKNDATQVHQMVGGSDLWHRSLTEYGIGRWLSSPMTFLFGNRVHRYEDTFYRKWVCISTRVEVAGKMGYYEAGLWTILAVTGIVGAALYVLVFFSLFKEIVPALVAHGIRTHADAFSFLAVSGALLWLLFCWIYGHFPSQELMLAAIARVACKDAHSTEELPIVKAEADPCQGICGTER